MSTYMTSLRRALLLIATLLSATTITFAQAWPTKPVTLVIPFPPGNTADLVARVLQPALTAALGVPVIVDNRPGAGGNVAAQFVARADKDGSTLLLTTLSPLVINPSVFRSPGFDAERDFTTVAGLGTIPMVLIARKDFPASTLPQFIEYVRTNQDKVTYASVGNGTFTHLGMELFNRSLGLRVTHVPYRGAGPAHQDLQGGRVDFMFDSVASSSTQIKGERVKPIATSGRTRSPFVMEAPTVIESGGAALRDFDVTVWTGLFAPTGTPPPVVSRMNDEINKLLRSSTFRAQLAGQFIRASEAMSPQAFNAIVTAERQRWGAVARGLNLEPQ
jgi:tripartite-type tricarboxylate transporter receptor subunit TctC